MSRTLIPTVPSFSPKTLDHFSIALKTITPMFGGSATAREVDPQFPVRAASVRGHLRFWWRATAGAQYSDPKKLHEAESAIWGRAAINTDQDKTADKQNKDCVGKVQIKVIYPHSNERPSNICPKNLTDVREKFKPPNAASYFTFPFVQGKKAYGLADIQFSLHISMQPQITAKQKGEIQCAIRAWIAFGGIGSRTRRGCGALTVTTEQQEWLASTPEQLTEWFGSGQRQPIKSKFTLLQGAKAYFMASQESDDVTDVTQSPWHKLGDFWRNFRTGFVIKRNKQETSLINETSWKDYETLKAWQYNKTKSIQLCKPYFGLPIIYQRGIFQRTLNAVNDYGTRLASPIILKPCAFLDEIRGMVLILNTPQPNKITIDQQECALEIPAFDPVLRESNVHGPLAAVGAAAKRCGYDKEVKL